MKNSDLLLYKWKNFTYLFRQSIQKISVLFFDFFTLIFKALLTFKYSNHA